MEKAVLEGNRRGDDVGGVILPCRSPRRYRVGFCPAILRIVHSGGVTE